jgi:acetyltransferase-like isoleucine patch superfamily enzyme
MVRDIHRLLRVLGITIRAPIGFVSCLLELTKVGARQSYYRSRHPGVRFDWGSIADEWSEFESPVTLLRNARIFGCRIGRYTYIGHNSEIQNTNIGRFCSIGPEVMIGLAAHPIGANISTSPLFYRSQAYASTPTFNDSMLFTSSTFRPVEHRLVRVGHDVWIGARVLIKGGLSIGNGAVIAAGAVVTHDIPPYAIAAGVPARILRYRFDTETVESLQQLKWWDKDVAWIRNHASDFGDLRILSKCCTLCRPNIGY